MTAHLLILASVAVLLTLSVRARGVRNRRRKAHSLVYEFYLRSPLWRARRRCWILSTRGRCEACGRRRRPLTIHHRTYRRLGRERRSDVIVLCWPCHHARHDNSDQSHRHPARLGGMAR